MAETCFVFIPDKLKRHSSGPIILKAKRKVSESCAGYFIIDDVESSAEARVQYVDKDRLKAENISDAKFHFENGNLKLLDDERGDKMKVDPRVVYYDLNEFQKVELFRSDDGFYFEWLKSLIKKDKDGVACGGFLVRARWFLLLISSFFVKIRQVTKYSSFIAHSEQTLLTLLDALNELITEGKLGLRYKNLLVARMLDASLGISTVYYLYEYEDQINNLLVDFVGVLIQELKEVLNYLLDSPAGLKLNYALSHTLGVFFFYHVSLWTAFVQASHVLLPTIFKLFWISGLFGASFQIAVFNDIIRFLTFHVYCVYVYAAKLYTLQVSSLTALWKLFIGRKYNPLRNRIDSFQYSPNQLFIGTLGFSILVFLLPTTFLYYAVFTVFRLSSVIVNRIIYQLVSWLEAFPLYVILLSMVRSSKLKGVINFDVDPKTNEIRVVLKPLPLNECIRATRPCTGSDNKGLNWGDILKGLLNGTLI